MIPSLIHDELGGIQLFGNCGKAVAANVQRISNWDGWSGPEDPAVYFIHERLQELHDRVVTENDETLWQTLLAEVLDFVKVTVPHDDNADAWHAPNTAAWQAAWTLLLHAWFVERGIEIPADLAAQHRWFLMGHWPCAVADLEQAHDISGYVVY
jgi:hypothetical protein